MSTATDHSTTAPKPTANPPVVTFAAAYALSVDTDALEPRYLCGEVVFVNPHRQITDRCFVACQLANGQWLVRRLLKRDGDILVLAWLNPEGRTSRYHFSDLRQVHRIVGAGDADDDCPEPAGSIGS